MREVRAINVLLARAVQRTSGAADRRSLISARRPATAGSRSEVTGVASPVVLAATHEETLAVIPLGVLQELAVDSQGGR